MGPNQQNGKRLLGIIGGVGPLASAEFLRTIYEQALGEKEQTAPGVIMYSDPSFPDRTEALLAGAQASLLEPLQKALRSLRKSGASRIVICCVTMHSLLPELPPEMRQHIWSLLDVIFGGLLQSRKRHLLICSSGTRQFEVLQHHRQWKIAQDYVVLPQAGDQELIHDLIYRIKRNEDIRQLVPILESLLAKYEVGMFIAGCTEIHLLSKHFNRASTAPANYRCLDPLTLIAHEVAKGNL
jgi:aspartate racemase